MTIKDFEKNSNLNFHGMNGKNALFSKEENLTARNITEQFIHNNFSASNINTKHYQNMLDNFYKTNSFFCEKLSEYKIEDSAFFFKSSKAFENYKADKKLLSTITKKDIQFLKQFKKTIELIPNLFDYKSEFDPDNRLNHLTFAAYKKNYRNILERNDELADSNEPYIPLSIENITEDFSDYYKTSELGTILTSQASYYNSEKDIFDRNFSKFYCSQLLEEIKDIEKNKNYGINDFIQTFSNYTKENPELSENSVSVMKHLFKSLSKTQKENVTRDFDKLSLNENTLKVYLDKNNLSLMREKSTEHEREL